MTYDNYDYDRQVMKESFLLPLKCRQKQTFSATPFQFSSFFVLNMSGVWDLVINLAHGHHSANKIMEELDRVFGPKASQSQPFIKSSRPSWQAGTPALN